MSVSSFEITFCSLRSDVYYSVVSSVRLHNWESSLKKIRSLMYMSNIREPGTDPCGALDVILSQEL